MTEAEIRKVYLDLIGDLTNALVEARRQLEIYEEDVSGETYNDPDLNSLIQLGKQTN